MKIHPLNVLSTIAVTVQGGSPVVHSFVGGGRSRMDDGDGHGHGLALIYLHRHPADDEPMSYGSGHVVYGRCMVVCDA